MFSLLKVCERCVVNIAWVIHYCGNDDD